MPSTTASTASRLKSPEHAEASEQRLRFGGEQVDAPLHRGADGLLALGHIPGARGEDREDAIEARHQRLGSEDADASRRELDRQRHAVERSADAGHGLGVLLGEVETGIRRSRAVPEQADRRRRQDLLQRGAVGSDRQAQRVDVVHVLVPQPESRPTRHEHRRIGQARQERRNHRRGCDHLLEVIEHDQVSPAGTRGDDPVEHGQLPHVSDPERPCDRGHHVAVLLDVLQCDERHPVEPVARATSDLERQARLADASCADQRDEPRAVVDTDPAEQRGDIRVASQHIGRRERQRLRSGVM